MRSKSCFASLLFGALAVAQTPGVLSIVAAEKLTLPRAGQAVQTLHLHLQPGYHANSNRPNDEYLIPMQLTWSPGPAEVLGIDYPQPTLEKSSFSDKPLSVYTGDFVIRTHFKRAAQAVPGPGWLTGKLRYQACNDKMCLPPRTLEVKAALLVE